MGHTHYWRVLKPKRGQTKQAKTIYLNTILECQLLIKTYSEANGGLSGYSAHTIPGQYGGVKVNGSRENACEDFVMRETLQQETESGGFCKTNRLPYDIVVTACLCVLNHRLGNSIQVSSDGDTLDWVKGLELARRVLNDNTIQIPKSVRRRIGVVC